MLDEEGAKYMINEPVQGVNDHDTYWQGIESKKSSQNDVCTCILIEPHNDNIL